MKTSIKIVLIVLTITLLIVGGFVAFLSLGNSGARKLFSVVPSDAIYVIETKNLTDGWKALSDSKMWKHIVGNPYFSDVQSMIASFDKMIKDNSTLDYLLSDRKMLVSAHPIAQNDYNFLVVVDIKQGAKLSLFKNALGLLDFSTETILYKNVEIIELNDKTTNDRYYLTFIDNLMVASFDRQLVERVINECHSEFWDKNTDFQRVTSEMGSNQLFSFYFNFRSYKQFMQCYFDTDDESSGLDRILTFSGFNVNLENEQLVFDGIVELDDTSSSYLKALSQVSKGEMTANKVISDKAALYLSLCFDNFPEFQEQLQKQFSAEQGADYESYSKRIKQTEKLLNVNLQQCLFSWIGCEIAFVKMRPTQESAVKDVVMVLNVKNIAQAKAGLSELSTKIRRRTPLKFDEIEHNGYTINFLNMKGLFKLFFGNLFDKLEKPYYTFIDDYVILSNSLPVIEDFIDDYESGTTLENSSDYQDFQKNFSSKTTVNVYLQVPNLYSNLYLFAKNQTRKSITDNKELILSFVRIGVQLTAEDGLFHTKMLAVHDENALAVDQINKLETESVEELINEDIESLSFKISYSTVKNNETMYQSTSFDSLMKLNAKPNELIMNGLWKTLYENGNVRCVVPYRNDKINGISRFYFDNDTTALQAEAVFEDDKMCANYREYYKNGQLKAEIEYDDGLKDGDAKFYYETGELKIKGGFKNGKRNGKWKYYTKDGELMNKEKYKKGDLNS